MLKVVIKDRCVLKKWLYIYLSIYIIGHHHVKSSFGANNPYLQVILFPFYKAWGTSPSLLWFAQRKLCQDAWRLKPKRLHSSSSVEHPEVFLQAWAGRTREVDWLRTWTRSPATQCPSWKRCLPLGLLAPSLDLQQSPDPCWRETAEVNFCPCHMRIRGTPSFHLWPQLLWPHQPLVRSRGNIGSVISVHIIRKPWVTNRSLGINQMIKQKVLLKKMFTAHCDLQVWPCSPGYTSTPGKPQTQKTLEPWIK